MNPQQQNTNSNPEQSQATATTGGAPAAPANEPKPKNAAPPKGNPNSTQNTLQISEIRDGLVIMNDGSFRSVVMCKSINFDLMSPEEREGVEYAYQGFLNSLYFEIQIFVRSTKVDISPYLQKLAKIKNEHDNMLLAVLMEDYLDFIAGIAEESNIMDKKFYVVIPYYHNPDTRAIAQASKGFLSTMFGNKEHKVTINEGTMIAAKDELKNRVQSVLGGLQQCGVQGIPLNTEELIELYYDSYNPDTAVRQPIRNFNELTAPVITKGQGEAKQPGLDKELGT